jgi:hypothetical protein
LAGFWVLYYLIACCEIPPSGDAKVFCMLSRSSHHSPWVELAALGERFNLTQVVEVAGSVQLAGEHGARIRSSLSAKAESLRHRQMSEIEAAANSSTERMGVPMVLLFLAFIVLIGYPAVTLIVGGL